MTDTHVSLVSEPTHRTAAYVRTGIGIGIGIGGLKSDGLAAPTVRTEKSYPA